MKKRFAAILCILTLAVAMVPARSMAEETPLQENASVNRNWYTMSDHTYDQVILDAVMNGIPETTMFGETRQDLIDLSDDRYGLNKENYGSIRFYLEYSTPELVGFVTLFRQYSYSTDATLGYYAWVTENCVAEREAFQARLPAVMEEVRALISTGASTFQKVHIVHDYLVSCTAYDYDNYADGDRLIGYDFDAYGVFVRHLSMCEGYSLAFKYIMEQLGIPCAVVISPTAAHAWNIVQIDGEWYHVDLSADDGLGYDMLGHVSHKYLCISTETLLAMSGNRSDFRIYFDSAEPVFTDETCATSKEYESGQVWNGCESCCHYIENAQGGLDLYTIDGASHALMKNGSRYFLPDGNTTWHPNGNSSAVYSEHHGRLAGEGPVLYMTTPESIYKIDTATDEKTVVYRVNPSDGAGSQIFGLAFVEHELYCMVCADTPKTDEVWRRVADYVPDLSGFFGEYGSDTWYLGGDRILTIDGSYLGDEMFYFRFYEAAYDEYGQMLECRCINDIPDRRAHISIFATNCRLFVAHKYDCAHAPISKSCTEIDLNDLWLQS